MAAPGRVGTVARSLSAGQLRAARLRAQLLGRPRADSVAAAASHLAGLQAQAAPPARLAVRARTSGLTAADADRAAGPGREVTRTWLMRGTLHLVATRDVRWMNRLFGPVNVAKGRRRREQLGLDDATCERALTALAAILAGSAPLTRAELVTRLADEGIRIGPRTQQPPHLLGYAAHRGLICRGPDAPGEEPTYVLLDDWAPDAPSLGRDEALAELARRYLGGYGPAGPADFTAWSGLPAADGKRAWGLIADALTPVTGAGQPLSALAGSDDLAGPGHPAAPGDRGRGGDRGGRGDPGPRLLGHFDPFLLGYRDRGLVLDPAFARRIQAGGGFIQPTVIVDGRVAGTWRLDRRAAAARLTIEPFTTLPRASLDGLAAEAADIGRFLGLGADPEMTVLT
jgi:DNA glycosylase AlkZ-like